MTKYLIAAAVVSFVACGSSQDRNAGRSQSPPPPPMGTIEQLLAPIALYPDPLLAQILISAADPKNVEALDKWLKGNQNVKGTQLQDAAVRAGFEPAFVALALFPQVVAKMAEQIAWTTLLGQTFTTERDAVFDAIQRLRQQAREVGTLKSTPQQEVETTTTPSGKDVIVIEPANPQVVYVPQYNPQVVYTQPPSTTVIVQEDDSAEEAIAAGLIGFTAGIAMGAAMDNHYYYSPYGWYGGAHMYNEAWDDYYDHREDAREDWMDHREDVIEDRSDRLENRQEEVSDRRENTGEQRTDRQQTRQENRPEAQGQRAAQRSAETSRATTQTAAQGQRSAAAQSATAQTPRTSPSATPEARGSGQASRGQVATQRSGGSSDPFSGYSSGASQRSSSARGQQSRSASRGGGGGGGRRR